MFILFLLIIILLGLGTGTIYIRKYENTISSLKLNLKLTKKQLNSIINKNKILFKDFTIEFLELDYIYGTLKESSNIYLVPDSTFPYLYITDESLTASIIEKASIKDVLWYYVKLPIDTNINSRGWVISSSFSSVYNEESPNTYTEQDSITSDKNK